MSKYLKLFANNLGNFLESLSVTKAELHRLTKISRSSIDDYLKEEAYPGLEVIESIAKALKISPLDFFRSSPNDGPHEIEECSKRVHAAIMTQSKMDFERAAYVIKFYSTQEQRAKLLAHLQENVSKTSQEKSHKE